MRIIKQAGIFAFGIGRTRFYFLLKSIRSLKSPRFASVNRDTVSGWIDNWNKFGFKGLEDEEKTGRPLILTVEEQEKAVETAMKNPKFPNRQLEEIKRESGKRISRWTL